MSVYHQLEYIRSKASQKHQQETKLRDSIQSRNEMFASSTTTRHSTIPNMTDAYKEVMNKNHQPTPEEIHYRRFTSGSWVDSE